MALNDLKCWFILDKKKDKKDSLESRLAPTGEELDEENAGSVHRYPWLSIHTYSKYILCQITIYQFINDHFSVTTQTTSLYRNLIKVQLKKKWQRSMRVWGVSGWEEGEVNPVLKFLSNNPRITI